MVCGYCKKEGHTILTCTEEGIEEERERRKNDPKVIARKEKVAAERAEKSRLLHEEHEIEMVDVGTTTRLHVPDLLPGRVVPKYASKCETVKGVVDLILDGALLQMILEAVEERREQNNLEMATRLQHRRDNPVKYVKKMEVAALRKGLPGACGGVVMMETVVSKQRRASTQGRQGTRGGSDWTAKAVYHQPFTACEVKKFLALHLYSSTMKIASLMDYWKESNEHSYSFVRRLFSRDRAKLLSRCFRFTDDQVWKIEIKMNTLMETLWVPATAAVVDESLVAHKGRKNPHHVFIMRKPHPHGLKVWSLVDYSGYFYAFSLFRRGGEPESSSGTLVRMSDKLDSGSVITADSYFGGIQSVQELSKRGKHCILSCNTKRPASIFQELLCKELTEDGQSRTLIGTTEGVPRRDRPGPRVPFMANAFQSKKRKLCTLSTVFSDTPEVTRFECLVEDEQMADQCLLMEVDEQRPQVRQRYADMMGYVDNADQHITSSLAPFRKHHWTSALVLWAVTMLLCVNGKRLYQSATGNADIKMPEFRDRVRRCLAGLPDDANAPHPPATAPDKDEPRSKARCRACTHFLMDESRTIRRCELCGPICKRCDEVPEGKLSRHEQLYRMPTTIVQPKRSYKREN